MRLIDADAFLLAIYMQINKLTLEKEPLTMKNTLLETMELIRKAPTVTSNPKKLIEIAEKLSEAAPPSYEDAMDYTINTLSRLACISGVSFDTAVREMAAMMDLEDEK